MEYISICSGIEGASVAWDPLGWKPVAFAEIEAFPRAVLKHRFPEVPLFDDFTQLRHNPIIARADLLVGGTPCQSFSVAGLRNSLDDDRGNLTLEYVRLINAIDDLRRDAGKDPAYALWENVPGVFSTHDNAFGAFLGAMVGSDAAVVPPRDGGWESAGVVAGPRRVAAWRVLDAQFFGLAQRRRRVFVLARGNPRGWKCADALLPIIQSLSGHTAPRRASGQRIAAAIGASPASSSSPNVGSGQGDVVAGTLTARGVNSFGEPEVDGNQFIPCEVSPTLSARTQGGGGLGTDFEVGGGLIAATITGALACGSGGKAYPGTSAQDAGEGFLVAHALRGEGFDASEDGTGRGTPLVPVPHVEVLPTMRAASGGAAHNQRSGDTRDDYVVPVKIFQDSEFGVQEYDSAGTLRAGRIPEHQMVLQPISFDPQAGGKQTRRGASVDGIGALGTTKISAVAFTQNSRSEVREIGGDGQIVGALAADAGAQQQNYIAFSCKDHGGVAAVDMAPTLRSMGHDGSHANAGGQVAIAIPIGADALRGEGAAITPSRDAEGRIRLRDPGLGIGDEGDPASTLAAAGPGAVATATSVRRLTPRECERLQGFPDDWTLVPFRGKPAADGPRYKALGNSFAVNVVRYIGERIQLVEDRDDE